MLAALADMPQPTTDMVKIILVNELLSLRWGNFDFFQRGDQRWITPFCRLSDELPIYIQATFPFCLNFRWTGEADKIPQVRSELDILPNQFDEGAANKPFIVPGHTINTAKYFSIDGYLDSYFVRCERFSSLNVTWIFQISI